MKKILLLPFLAITLSINAQTTIDYTLADNVALEVPRDGTQNVKELAGHLTKGLDTDLEKARAFYVWIANNIKYDARFYFNDKRTPQQIKDRQKVSNVLRTKIAVCEGYSNLFHELCLEAGIPSIFVSGFTKTNKGRIPRTTHAWNVIKVDGKWVLIDSTWGAGYVDEDKKRFNRYFKEQYFMALPEQFVLDHLPHDPIFQIQSNPVSLKVFSESENAILEHLKENAQPDFEHFQDTLDFYYSLDERARLKNSFERILRFDSNSSYGNFKGFDYHFNESRDAFDQYKAATTPVFEKRSIPEKEQLREWEAYIRQAKTDIHLAETYVKKIKPGDRFYKYAIPGKKNINIMNKNLEIADKQLAQFRRFFKN
ncbi:MAG: hypothetical protein DWQ02_27920 [Bacteroidetes bacterium]|nr:MAG: hypothetical protein DWQ02_27920 [Bacteroidota bacterium]